MTREEQIYEAADKATYQTPPQYSELVHKSRKVMSAYEVGFIDGCVWADQHPQWIPVEEELPKCNIVDCGLATYPVLVYREDGFIDISCYDSEVGEWDCVGVVTYWMPMPQPPRKEE